MKDLLIRSEWDIMGYNKYNVRINALFYHLKLLNVVRE